MTLAELQQTACDRLAADEWLASRRLSFVPEQKRDAAAEAEAALRRCGIFGLVVTPSFQPRNVDGAVVCGEAVVGILIEESVPANRAAAGYATALQAAEHILCFIATWADATPGPISMVEPSTKDAVSYRVDALFQIAISLTQE
jgi:hypothetical protein